LLQIAISEQLQNIYTAHNNMGHMYLKAKDGDLGELFFFGGVNSKSKGQPSIYLVEGSGEAQAEEVESHRRRREEDYLGLWLCASEVGIPAISGSAIASSFEDSKMTRIYMLFIDQNLTI
jgi:hypothetical protein